jgi:hypothetical protein
VVVGIKSFSTCCCCLDFLKSQVLTYYCGRLARLQTAAACMWGALYCCGNSIEHQQPQRRRQQARGVFFPIVPPTTNRRCCALK